MNKKIFIGGTGRSGTTILSRLLGSHKEIYNLPVETRFIIDKGGLIDLFYALTKNYSPDQSRVALREFYDLMKNKMVQPLTAPYVGFDFYSLFGKNFYGEKLESFVNRIIFGRFVGTDFHATYEPWSISTFLRNKFREHYKFYRRAKRRVFHSRFDVPISEWPKEEMFVCKHFLDENELKILMGVFVNDLFTCSANMNKKIHWCEDTPANIFHVDFLDGLFSQAYFIHIVRNPVGVAFSMKNMLWAPNDYATIADFLSAMYEKLMRAKEFAIARGINFKEIRLEDLAGNYGPQKDELIAFLGVRDAFIGAPQIDIRKVNYYEEKMPKEDREFLMNKLEKYINYYNY